MKIIKTQKLAKNQREEISDLAAACIKKWSMSLSFPFEDGTSFYLLYDPYLVSALALISRKSAPASESSAGVIPREPECVSAECVAFTHPSALRKGYFSALLAAAEEEIEDIDLLFLTDGSNEGAKKTLAALGAELDFVEYRMELSDSDCENTFTSHRLFCSPCKDGETLQITFHLEDPTGTVAGKAMAACCNTSVCLYGFEISEALRGQGLGREALKLYLDYVKSQGAHLVFLHVSGDNLPAVKLYEKTGFRITETLSYYLY